MRTLETEEIGKAYAGRQVVRGIELSPSRVGLCCERAVGIVSTNTNTAFLRTTAGKLRAFERALDQGDAVTLADMVDATVQLLKGEEPREKFLDRVRRRNAAAREHWLVHDVCEVQLTAVAGQPAWSADCRTLSGEDGRVAYVLRRYLFGGADGKLQAFGEPKAFRQLAEP